MFLKIYKNLCNLCFDDILQSNLRISGSTIDIVLRSSTYVTYKLRIRIEAPADGDCLKCEYIPYILRLISISL